MAGARADRLRCAGCVRPRSISRSSSWLARAGIRSRCGRPGSRPGARGEHDIAPRFSHPGVWRFAKMRPCGRGSSASTVALHAPGCSVEHFLDRSASISVGADANVATVRVTSTASHTRPTRPRTRASCPEPGVSFQDSLAMRAPMIGGGSRAATRRLDVLRGPAVRRQKASVERERSRAAARGPRSRQVTTAGPDDGTCRLPSEPPRPVPVHPVQWPNHEFHSHECHSSVRPARCVWPCLQSLLGTRRWRRTRLARGPPGEPVGSTGRTVAEVAIREARVAKCRWCHAERGLRLRLPRRAGGPQLAVPSGHVHPESNSAIAPVKAPPRAASHAGLCRRRARLHRR